MREWTIGFEDKSEGAQAVSVFAWAGHFSEPEDFYLRIDQKQEQKMADVIWTVKLDKRFDVKVTRTGDHTADLTVAENGVELYYEPVTLAFRALLGPDVADVAQWEEIATKFVDSL